MAGCGRHELTGMSAVVDTHGWDLVVGLPLSAANAALAAAATTLYTSFSYSGTSMGQAYTLAGEFGAWSIAGGANDDLLLSLPITSGTLVVSGSSGLLKAGTTQLAGAVVTVAARLAFTAAPDGVTSLAFDLSGSPPASPAPGAPTASGRVTGTALLDPMTAALVPVAVAECLAANAEEISFVFATLTPACAVGLSFIAKPGAPRLEYLVDDSTGTPSLYVLCAVNNGATLPARAGQAAGSVPLQPLVPEAMSVTEGQASVALSQAVVLSQVLRGALAQGLQRAQYPEGGAPGMLGPQLHAQTPPATVSASMFAATVTDDSTGSVQNVQPLQLNMLGLTEAAPILITDLTCSISGAAVTLDYTVGPMPSGDALIVSQSYTASIGPDATLAAGSNGSGFTLVATGNATVAAAPGALSLDSNVEWFAINRLQPTLNGAFFWSPTALGVTLLGGVAIAAQAGYLDGGVLFTGPIVLPPR